MSLDAMKQALEALEEVNKLSIGENAICLPAEIDGAMDALRAAIEQAQGLADKVPARGTLLEQTLGKVWDEMPHAALMDALVGGTGVMLGDKRIDPASIYKQPDQEPVAWMHPSWIDPDTRGWASDSFNAIPIEGWVPVYTAPRQWQELTKDDSPKTL